MAFRFDRRSRKSETSRGLHRYGRRRDTRIENLISEWIPTTQVSEINRNAGIKLVKVDCELFELTKRALHYSQISDGAFDISFVAADGISSMAHAAISHAKAIAASVRKIGYRNIVLDKQNGTRTSSIRAPVIRL